MFMATDIMVELHHGYGDGYGIVAETDTGTASKVTHYDDGSPMELWRAEIMSLPSVALVDKWVRVPRSAIKRVVGPLGCPEAKRIECIRYTKNWDDTNFVSLATDAEIVSAMSHDSERDTYAALKTLRAKYAGQ